MSNQLTLEEKATNFDTMRHIGRVRDLLQAFAKELLDRGSVHDRSKLERPEVEEFTKHTAALALVTYGSAEYNAAKAAMRPALEHHYANNSHHPEHYKHGIDDMNLLDIVEMLCDWKASSERHNDGNLRKSIEINGNRFEMSPQLIRIFENTVGFMEGR